MALCRRYTRSAPTPAKDAALKFDARFTASVMAASYETVYHQLIEGRSA